MNRGTTFDSLDWEGLLGVALAQAEAIERQGTEIATRESAPQPQKDLTAVSQVMTSS